MAIDPRFLQRVRGHRQRKRNVAAKAPRYLARVIEPVVLRYPQFQFNPDRDLSVGALAAALGLLESRR